MKQNVRIKWATGIMTLVLTLLLRSATCSNVPSAVTMLRTTGVAIHGDPNITQPIAWERPQDHNSTLEYVITYSRIGQANTVGTTNGTSFNLSLPTPKMKTDYTVSVAARSDAGIGTATEYNIQYKKPKPPGRVQTLNITCNSIAVTWKAPEDTGGLELLGYRIEESQRTVDCNAVQHTAIRNLRANTKYRVAVKAKNSIGLSMIKRIDANTTAKDDVGMTAISPDSTKIQVNITSSQKYKCSAREKDAEKYSHINTSTEGIGLFQGLTSNTEYSINCTGMDNACDIAKTTATTRSGAPDPPSIAVNPTTTCQSMQISWTPPTYTGTDKIRSYTVTYYISRAPQTAHKLTKSVNNMTLSLIGLTPNTEYTVLVNASNSQLSGEAANITVKTASRGQGNITVMEASISATSVRLQHPLGQDVNYKCNIIGSSTDQFNIPADDVYTLSGLSADSTYTVKCVAYKDEVEHCLEANETFETLPGRVGNIQIENMGMVTMDGQNRKVQQTISWDRPENHSSTLNYTAKYGRASSVSRPDDSSARETTVTGSNTMATLSLLLPNSSGNIVNYKVWVAARSSTGQGEYSEQLNITYTAPAEPNDVTVVPLSCNSVNITWKPPVNTGHLTLTQYTVQYQDPTINMITHANTTFLMVNNLIPGEMYTVQVNANNGFKDSKLSESATNTTQMRDRTNIATFNATSTKISLTLVHNKKAFECHVDSKDMAVGFDNNSNGHVSDLTPDTDYNIGCVGTASKTKCFEQNETVRTAPGRVKSVMTTGLGMVVENIMYDIYQRISWEKPQNHSSRLTYTVKYGKNRMINHANNMATHNITGTATIVMFKIPDKLTAPLSYYVWVAAVSAAGEGPYSRKIDANYGAPNAPKNFAIGEHTCNALLLRWTAPESTGGLPITEYQIEYLENSNSTMVEGNMTFATIENLHPNTTYKIRVRALNSLGSGMFIKMKTRTTTVQRNSTTSIQVQATSSTSVQVTRTIGDEQYKCILNTSPSTAVRLTTSNSTATVPALLADTIYSISCIEVDTKDNYQCTEYNTTVHTELSAVTGLVNINATIHNTSHYNQEIQWNRTTSTEQVISNYSILYMKNGDENNQTNTEATRSATLILPLPSEATSYKVWVAAVGSVTGVGEYSQPLVIPLDEPGQPTNVTVTAPSCNTITVAWSPPNDSGGLPITEYTVKSRVSSSNNERTENHTTLSASIRNVFPGIQYTVLVAAVNFEPGQFSDDESITMPIRDNTSSIKVNRTSHTTLLLSSTSTEADYKCSVSNNMEYDLLSENSAEILSLEYDIEYSVDCVEMEDGYAQCTEYNTTILTGLPEVMNLQHQDITVYDSTNIHQPLTWQSLTSNHQAVTNYSIRYSLSAQKCSQQDGAFKDVTSTTNGQSLVLPVPMSETQYTVCVAAVGNETGTGVYSKLQINYTEPDAPLLRAIDVQSCKNVIMAWDAPQDKGGLPIQGYQLHYYSDPTQEPVVLNISGNTTEKELDNLLPGTEYTFVIKATTSIATDSNNTLSNTTHFRGSADEILIATPDKSRMINMTSKNGTLFICWINKTKDQYENYTVNETTTVEGLQPDTLYSIDCVEINSNGEYQCRKLNTTVLTGLPPPTNIMIESVSLNKHNTKVLQTIQWDLLKSGHQMVEQYTFKYGIDSEIEKATEANVNLVINEQNKVAIKFSIPQEPITYFVWVAGKGSRTGVGEYSEALQITYTAPNQPSKINTAKLTCNAIQLTWEQPENDGGLPIQGYHVSYSTATGNYSTYTTESSIEWLDRLPNTAYDVCIRANNSILNQTCEPYGITTSPRNKTTDEEVSLDFIPPGRLNFVKRAITNNRFKCWVVGGKGDTSFNLRRTASQKIVGPLQTDSQYTLSCVEIDGMNKYQCKEFNRTTSIGVPKVTLPPEQRQAEKFNKIHFKQHIIWENVPPSSDQNITNYTMLIRTDDTNQVTETNRTVHTNFEELSLPIPTSPITYYIQVAAVGSNTGQGEYSDNFTRTYTYPEPPDDLTVGSKSISCNTYSIKWTEMVKSGELPVTNYKVTVTNANNAVIYNETISPEANMSEHQLDLDNYYNKSKLFQDLLPNMTYTVHVTTTNLLGESKDNKTVTATTTPKENLSIEMQPFSSTGAHLLIWPQYNNTVNYSCSLTALQAENYTESTIELNNTLSELSPNTTYSVWCLAYEEDRERELCYEGRAEGGTFPLKPEKPPTNITVNAITSDRFVLTWSGPEGYQNNQDIRGYQVTYNWTSDDERKLKETNTTSLTYTASNLTRPGTEHTVAIAAYTANGTGIYSDPLKITTIPTVENILATDRTAASAVITWDPPPDNYTIWLERRVADNFTYGNRSIILTSPTSRTSYTLTDLDSFRNYSISMYLELSNLGNGTESEEHFKTQGKEPTSTPNNRAVNTNKTFAKLKWRIPSISERNGIINSYHIEWTSLGTAQAQTSPIIYNLTNPSFTHPQKISYTLKSLTPFTNYQWRVAAVNEKGVGPFSVLYIFTTEEDEPGNVTGIELHVNGSSNTTLLVTWQKPTPPNGHITKYKVCYGIEGKSQEQINCHCSGTEVPPERQLQLNTLRPGIPYQVSVQAFTKVGGGNISTHNSAVFTKELKPNRTVGDFSISWMGKNTMNVSWSPLDLHEARGHPVYTVTVKSKSNDREIRKITVNESSVVFNYLSPDLEYIVTVDVATTAGSVRVSKNFGEAKSDVLIIGLVVAVPLALVLCIIGIIVMIIIIARCKRTSKGSYEIREPEVIDLPQIVAAVMDDKLIACRNIQRKDAISKRNFSEHVRNLHTNKDSRFKSEFEKITKEPAVSNNIAQENRTKNRYVNIFGYDYCRVILNNPDEGDYVNAAYIDGYKKPQKYIATQGPTPSTTMDFWEMIWEQKASVVIMLTRLVEGTKTKCEKYWNEEIDGQYQPGRNLNITTKSYRVMPGFEVRYFEVQKMSDEFEKSSPLKVKQFLYTAWPDHGVPQYSSSMVKFIMKQIRPEVQNSSAPIIVHCSAGAGRTGTLIAIDTTIDRLEEEGDINIFECVELMRARRTQMVQTSSQYIYIHDAINDFVTCGDTAIAAHELGPRTMGLHQVEFGGLHTAFEEQFYTLEGTSPELCKADHDFAELPKVKPRNRYSGLHTYSDNFIETEDEENYVNATEIPGYYGQNHFLAAQAPMKNTVEDTWNVIREQDCKVVVVLTNFNEDGQEMCAPFWPTEAGVPMEVGFMKINLVHTLNYERYDVSEVSVTVQDSDIVTTAKVHHYKAWKKNGRPDVPSLLRLMGDVQRSHQGKKNPLLVMCDDGMSRTGVFITVMSEIDRVKVEGEVDIFHTVKAARKARPHMVSTVFDYELCHEILLNYLESFDTYANFKI